MNRFFRPEIFIGFICGAIFAIFSECVFWDPCTGTNLCGLLRTHPIRNLPAQPWPLSIESLGPSTTIGR